MNYVVLLRGINVGLQNRISMTELRQHLEDSGFEDVKTYINSGNVLLTSSLQAEQVQRQIEELLPKKFTLDSAVIKVLVVSKKQLQAIIADKPKGFGDQPEKYYSDVIFLMDTTVEEALPAFNPRDGVDRIWPGNSVVYSERLGAMRTKSRLNKIIGHPVYKSMTIRSWGTTTKLLDLLDNRKESG